MVDYSNLSRDTFSESAAEEKFRLAAKSCPSIVAVARDLAGAVHDRPRLKSLPSAKETA
jgi:hypothetical protein